MPDLEVHFHCAFVGGGKFRVTMTPVATPENVGVVELTEIELARFVKRIHPGQARLGVGRLSVEMSAVRIARVKEYIELVLSSYQEGLDKGIDHDAKLKEWRGNIDPIGGSEPLPRRADK